MVYRLYFYKYTQKSSKATTSSHGNMVDFRLLIIYHKYLDKSYIETIPSSELKAVNVFVFRS